MRAAPLLLPALLLAACDGPGLLSPGDPRLAISPEIAPPSNVQTSRVHNGRVRISFDHDGSALHRVVLYRSTSSGGPWVEVKGVNNPDVRVFSDGAYPVTASAVWWRVQACTRSGACSDSEPVQRTDLRIAPLAGHAGLALNSSADSVTIQWPNAANHATWGSEPWLPSFELVVTRIGPANDTTVIVRQLPQMPAVIVFTDSAPADDVVYEYRPRIRNMVGTGAQPTSSFYAFTGSPAPPASATATLQANGRVMVEVGHDGQRLTRWQVQSRRPGEPWGIAWQRDLPSLRTFELPYDVRSDLWEWRVLACRKITTFLDPDDMGTNLFACASSEVLWMGGLQLFPPTGLHLLGNQPYSVVLGWTDGSGPIVRTGVVRRDESTGARTMVGSVPFGITTYEDRTAKPWQAYSYRVYGYNAVGGTDSTAWVHVAPSQTDFPPPQAVTDSAVALNGGIRVHGRASRTPAPQMVSRAWMQWSANADFSGAQQTSPVTLGADSLIRISGTFTPGAAGTYYFRTVAENELGARSYGETRTFAYQAPPPATDLSGQAYPSGAVVIFYAHPGTQVSRWRLFRRAIGSATWVNVRNNLDPTARHLIDSSVPGGPSGYEWRVEACTYQLCAPSAPFSFGAG